MTKKDFKIIAKIISELDLWDHRDDSQRASIAEQFANELRAYNPRFDRTKFMEACLGKTLVD